MVRVPTHGPATHPGEMLMEEFLKPLGLSQAGVAEKLGVSYPRVNELVHGRRGVTPDTALRLERLFGVEAQFWLNLQLVWDLYQAQHSAAARHIRKIRRLPRLAKATR
jgi:antitoxin HigA-1